MNHLPSPQRQRSEQAEERFCELLEPQGRAEHEPRSQSAPQWPQISSGDGTPQKQPWPQPQPCGQQAQQAQLPQNSRHHQPRKQSFQSLQGPLPQAVQQNCQTVQALQSSSMCQPFQQVVEQHHQTAQAMQRNDQSFQVPQNSQAPHQRHFRSLLLHFRSAGRGAFWWHGLARPMQNLEEEWPQALQSREERQPLALEPMLKRPRGDSEKQPRCKLEALAEYLEERGGSRDIIAGWTTTTEVRKTGNSAGNSDSYWFSPDGTRFRSMAEVARHFQLGPPKDQKKQQ
mmetsp:Transcript_44938/g.80827  ORF Transcript_44938/g.80827 Transcript_44938/m.80827 type:complete len:286 (-) Transcript_44938:52-909(-)